MPLFNKLALGGTPEEVTERVFNAFDFEDAYYRSVQFEIFSQIMRIFDQIGEVPTFLRVHQAISNPAALYAMMKDCQDGPLKWWLGQFKDLTPNDRLQRVSGLTAALSHFAFGQTAALFNTEEPTIDVGQALAKNQIVYFQLPVLLAPFLGKASGKMVLQCLQGAVANRHRGMNRRLDFFSVFLDDFSEYLCPGFVSILNKSRSANVGIVFAHQALGDIRTLGDAVANSILTNANLKIFMRGNDPESAEYFSQVIGTTKSVKYTERKKRGFLSEKDTGDASAREVYEFIVHPNRFKSGLGVGEGIMVIPHQSGSSSYKVKFRKYDDLPERQMEVVAKKAAGSLSILESRSLTEESKKIPTRNGRRLNESVN